MTLPRTFEDPKQFDGRMGNTPQAYDALNRIRAMAAAAQARHAYTQATATIIAFPQRAGTR